MFDQKKIEIINNTKAAEITGSGVRCVNTDGETFYAADTLIYATGMRPLQEEVIEFNQCAEAFYMVGECRKAANILYATATAHYAVKLIGSKSFD